MQGDVEMVRGKMPANVTENKAVTIALPRALVTFAKETTFTIRANIDDGAEQEILSKKVMVGGIS